MLSKHSPVDTARRRLLLEGPRLRIEPGVTPQPNGKLFRREHVLVVVSIDLRERIEAEAPPVLGRREAHWETVAEAEAEVVMVAGSRRLCA